MLTEYHESKRIDWQLFGRGGRQDDPGGYECFAALDDEISRGAQRISAVRRIARRLSHGTAPEVPTWLARLLVRQAQGDAGRLQRANQTRNVGQRSEDGYSVGIRRTGRMKMVGHLEFCPVTGKV
jgi:preprotein translocase subunit SecA